MKKCIVTGSFDPITLGHIDLIERALDIFDFVYVAILVNPVKKSLFETHDKLAIAKKATERYGKMVEVISYYGLAAELAKELQVDYFVRGIRNGSDFGYEIEMAEYNKIAGEVETVLLVTDVNKKDISSSKVRERLLNNEDISEIVPPEVENLITSIYKKSIKK